MACDICGKPEFIEINIIGNFGKKKIHLCEDCYRDYKKKVEETLAYGREDGENFDFGQILEEIAKGIFQSMGAVPIYNIQDLSSNKDYDDACPNCGYSKRELIRNREVGCPHCYDHFADTIFKMRKNESEEKYQGQIPSRYKRLAILLKDIDLDNKKLSEYISNEEFEKAQEIKDLINDKKLQVEKIKEDLNE
ncbi:MAG: UvrB/UvrC motif-containing protein [Finegoldia sp.]|nr:UvrB/UvrC motif-containing protein [Finegoldia sp.]